MPTLRILTEVVSQNFVTTDIDVPDSWDLDNLTSEQISIIKTSAKDSNLKIEHEKTSQESLVTVKNIDDINQTQVPQLAKIEVEGGIDRYPVFTLYNSSPTYLKAANLISFDSAKFLMDLVDSKGTASAWTDNPSTLEYQLANPYKDNNDITNPYYKDILFELNIIANIGFKHLSDSFINSGFSSILSHHGFWIMKYTESASFESHCDFSSVQGGISPPVSGTLAILLNDDFTGGDLILYDSTGKPAYQDSSKTKYEGIMWDGLTMHQVSTIDAGNRYCLVIHYTGKTK